MVDGLKQASNYDPFVAFAHTIFWAFIPLMVWCGWQAVKTASSKDNMIFLHKSKFMKIGSYCFFLGISLYAFFGSMPISHRWHEGLYLNTGFEWMAFDFWAQAMVYYFLGMSVRYMLLEFQNFSVKKEA